MSRLGRTASHRLIMFYICTKICQSFSKDFRVTDLKVGLTLEWSQILTDGRTCGLTNGRKTGFRYRTMPEAGATKIKKMVRYYENAAIKVCKRCKYGMTIYSSLIMSLCLGYLNFYTGHERVGKKSLRN